MITEDEKRLEKAWADVREQIPFRPKVALVLGSGLGGLVREKEAEAVIPYAKISGFPVPTVSGHAGKFLFARIGHVPVVVMQGRVHYYEGYSMKDVVFPVRLMRRMGAEILFLTNAAGGIDRSFSPGTIMMITDQISSFVPSPLIGPNPETIGVRFPDMGDLYDGELCSLIREAAGQHEIDLREGVYIQLSGPNYESPAEIRMCRVIGADAVGMSTAVEAIAARHAGFRVCGLSLITNMASGITEEKLSHEEVQKAAGAAAPVLQLLIRSCISKMA